MKSFVLISAICLQVGWGNAKGFSTGAGAFSFQDSSGTRYAGTYGLKDGEVVDAKGTFPPDFKPERDFLPPTFDEPENFLGFFPEYFRNLENLLQEAFQTNVDSQRLAMDAAHKAFDLTSNQAGISPNLNPSRLATFNDNSRSGFPGMPQFPSGFPFNGGFPMQDFGDGASRSAAFAGAAVGPDYNRQMAAINPANPNNPNIIKSSVGTNPGGFKSVSVSSYSSSSDINGQKSSSRGAQTMVNDNGKITGYSVRS